MFVVSFVMEMKVWTGRFIFPTAPTKR